MTDSELVRRDSVDEYGSVALKSPEFKQNPSYRGPSYRDTPVYLRKTSGGKRNTPPLEYSIENQQATYIS